jgi:hypothetical protein
MLEGEEEEKRRRRIPLSWRGKFHFATSATLVVGIAFHAGIRRLERTHVMALTL